MTEFVPAISLRQGSFFELNPIVDAVTALANAGGNERGAIFTKREVVDFILDLAGYTTDRPLHSLTLLEPSFGGGDFLVPAIERLLVAWRLSGASNGAVVNSLAGSIRAVELHRGSFEATRIKVIETLRGGEILAADAQALADHWLLHGDFLLADIGGPFDVVVGNPPYVRSELIPTVLMAEYRARYATVYDRADLYIPFIERSLTSLSPGGQLGFICADRWMKNRYGGPLRRLVAQRFHLKIYVDMVGTQAFHTEVTAYPAITVIASAPPSVTRVARRPSLDAATLRALADELVDPSAPKNNSTVDVMDTVTDGSEPWILDASGQLDLIRRLEAQFPTLDKAGCKVGIGVATGADDAFIGLLDRLDVEDDRKLPIVMTRDIKNGTVEWRGFGVINPFADGAGLVDLADYPRLKRYLEARKSLIANRHCAQKTPANWYRTIDRITPAIARMQKLLIPDIKGEANIVLENGRLYPHHNLYYITSETWNLKALQAVLRSRVTRLFIATYSTRMRGGFLRFQAQYLRRLRLPLWDQVPVMIRDALIQAADTHDAIACDRASFALYHLRGEEIAALNSVDDR